MDTLVIKGSKIKKIFFGFKNIYNMKIYISSTNNTFWSKDKIPLAIYHKALDKSATYRSHISYKYITNEKTVNRNSV